MNDFVLVLDNIRSTHNVGSILRTCDGFGVKQVYACGLTPHPYVKEDQRLPHVSKRAHEQIAKTALGAEESVTVTHFNNLKDALNSLRSEDFEIWAIEQAENSSTLDKVDAKNKKIALVLGNEVGGVDMTNSFDKVIEIPMKGQKESFNVSVTAGIVLYQLTR